MGHIAMGSIHESLSTYPSLNGMLLQMFLYYKIVSDLKHVWIFPSKI